MAAASSSHSSITLRHLPLQTQRPFFAHLGPNNIIVPRHPSPCPFIAFARPARRRNAAQSSIKSSKKKKKRLPRNDVAEEEDSDDDALEALFSQLEEDLANDDQSLDEDEDDDDEVGEEDLANLERELAEAEASEEDEQLVSFDAHEGDGVISESEDDDDEDDPEEELGKLKTWQLRRLAYALKHGRRKTGIKNLAADVCLDRAIVLKLLRDPPPKLLLLSATLPDKSISPILEPEREPLEKVSSDAAAEVEQPKSKVQVPVPVHVRQSSWSGRKRLKKVQVRTLERVYAQTKRPTNTMVSSIVSVTNLPRKKVVDWFEDKRNEDGVPGNRLPYRRIVEDEEEDEDEEEEEEEEEDEEFGSSVTPPKQSIMC